MRSNASFLEILDKKRKHHPFGQVHDTSGICHTFNLIAHSNLREQPISFTSISFTLLVLQRKGVNPQVHFLLGLERGGWGNNVTAICKEWESDVNEMQRLDFRICEGEDQLVITWWQMDCPQV